jgi:hypothetical protein
MRCAIETIRDQNLATIPNGRPPEYELLPLSVSRNDTRLADAFQLSALRLLFLGSWCAGHGERIRCLTNPPFRGARASAYRANA